MVPQLSCIQCSGVTRNGALLLAIVNAQTKPFSLGSNLHDQYLLSINLAGCCPNCQAHVCLSVYTAVQAVCTWSCTQYLCCAIIKQQSVNFPSYQLLKRAGTIAILSWVDNAQCQTLKGLCGPKCVTELMVHVFSGMAVKVHSQAQP